MSDFYYDPEEPYVRPPTRILVTPPGSRPPEGDPMGSLADQSQPPQNIVPPQTILKNNTLPEVEKPDLIQRMLPERDPRIPLSDLQAQQRMIAFGSTLAPGEKRGFGAIDLTPMGSIAQMGGAIESQDPFTAASMFTPGGGAVAGAASKFAPAMFIGAGAAKGFSQDALKVAKRMQREGATPQQIYEATTDLTKGQLGLEKGLDRKWRTEISDADATVNQDVLSKAPIPGQTTLNVGFALPSVFNHPKLYEAYPWMQNTEVWRLPGKDFMGRKNLTRGAFDPENGRIYLNENLSPDEARDVLLHELQHSIQRFEDFARGGNNELPSVAKRGKKIEMEVFLDVKQRLDALRAQRQADINATYGNDTVVNADRAEKWAKQNPQAARELQQASRMMQDIPAAARFEAYKRMVGEWEARNTTKRADLTNEGRFLARTETTGDYPTNKLWVRKADDPNKLQLDTSAPGSIFTPAAPAIIRAPEMPTRADINKIYRAAQQFGRKGWPTAESEIFKTTPEAYASTTQLVPQFSIRDTLPGPVPGRPLPKGGRIEPVIQNEDEIAARVAERLYPMVQRQDPTLKFYHTGPVIQGLRDIVGMDPTQANMFMRRWAGQGAATSPRTQTPPNLRNSSYLMYRREQGEPFDTAAFREEGNRPGFPMMKMHTELADKFAHGINDPWINPKPSTFRENWSGNLQDVTTDTHNIRSTLYELDRLKPGSLPRGWFASDDAYRRYRRDGFMELNAGDIVDQLASQSAGGQRRQAEYLPMTAPWYGAAKKLGIAPAEAQSGGWFSYGPITGLQSPPKTIVNLLNDQIEATAKALGVAKERVLQWWAQGKIPLASLGGGIMGGAAAQDQYQPQERSYG